MKVELNEAQWLRATVALAKDIEMMQAELANDGDKADGFWESRIADAEEALITIQEAGNL